MGRGDAAGFAAQGAVSAFKSLISEAGLRFRVLPGVDS
jgi:hypothetical protein